MKLHERFKAIKELETVDVPFHIRAALGTIEFHGSGVSLAKDSDFISLQDAKLVAEWLVDQLGGNVKWSKE